MIRIYNQRQFRGLTPNSDSAVISIQSPEVIFPGGLKQLGTTFVPEPGWGPLLILPFHDILPEDRDEDTYKLFSEAMAETTVSFIERNLERDFTIHCDAGMSRSVAVGSFIADFYDKPMELWATHGRQDLNIHVYNLLRRQNWRDRL